MLLCWVCELFACFGWNEDLTLLSHSSDCRGVYGCGVVSFSLCYSLIHSLSLRFATWNYQLLKI